MKPFRKFFRPAHGVTILELLVVLVVVGTLFAMLFFGVNKASRGARSAKCVSNLRQIHAALMQYTLDHQGRLIPADGSGIRWYQQVWSTNTLDSPLAAYVGGGESLGKIAVCPENATPLAGVMVDGVHVKNKTGYPYVVNYAILIDSQRFLDGESVLFRQVARPSLTPLITDSNFGTAWGGPGWEGARAHTNQVRIGEPHFNKTNVLWCDGHVSSSTRDEVKAQIVLINR